MSYVEMTNKIVTCRKNHPCTWCGERVAVGSEARYRTGIFEDHFSSGHEHPECYKAILDSADLFDGYTPYEQQRGKTMEESHQ